MENPITFFNLIVVCFVLLRKSCTIIPTGWFLFTDFSQIDTKSTGSYFLGEKRTNCNHF